jgi:hypothetical protein
MNQFVLNIMIVYSIASIIYLLSLFFMKSKKIKDILNNEQLEEYNKIRKQKIMIFIIGIVIGLCFIILFDNISKTETIINKSSVNMKNIVEDVSDISVI